MHWFWCVVGLVASSLAQASGPEAIHPLEPYRKTVALRAQVGGHPGLFTFDTAGGITLISPDLARKIDCRPWGRLSGHRMMGNRLDMPRCDAVTLRLGSQDLRLPVIGVLDIAPLIAKDAAPVDGSIALDAFAGKTITIDFPAMRLIVESPESLRERIAGAESLPVRLSRELQGRALAASIGVPGSRGMTWMELDSGNGGTILVAQPYAKQFGLDPGEKGPQQVDFRVSTGLRAKGMAFTPDMILDGNLGMPFLRDKVVTLDLSAGRLWISQVDSDP
ncbi:hypothetical protein IP90_01037 [Luteimonas cucumeris]|uniref:Aspartyl protease n=1 Tax=Luteimonas cucumeris TaxID=985012 RepID=A0A562LBH6_9GAMM|nr:hypothetical protein [Luteimonas cucumeris]TWI04895.1 hypothetical protein IP90_01037 [Luteimonas cucumeris]